MDPSPAEQRAKLRGLLGRLPDLRQDPTAQCLQVRETPHYHAERLLLDLNGIQQVPAWFVLPKDATGRVPAVLYSHAHGGDYALGKDEFLEGRSSLQAPPYAEALAARGYAGLCIDAWGFGERSGPTESSLFKLMLWRGQVLWGMMVYDALRALDYLAARPEIDPARLAAMGFSMGSTVSWWAAALDERLKVCVDFCCLTDYDALIEAEGLDLHGLYYFVPDLLNHFSTASINALIAPRPHLALAGIRDPLTPPAGLDRIDRHLQKIYSEQGAPDSWRLFRSDTAHGETPQMRTEALAWLQRWL